MMAEIFEVLASINVIHADIKPNNRLVALNMETNRIADLKLIDFGSAFHSDQPSVKHARILGSRSTRLP